MSEVPLPSNVYRLPQRRFDAIPGAPWVYWVGDGIRYLFEHLDFLKSVAVPRQGLTTADNTRFIRYWWETGLARIGFGNSTRAQAQQARRKWYPLVKGGQSKKWYGAELSIGNWEHDGEEIKAYIVERYPYLNGKWEWVAKNPEYYFLEGAAYSSVTSGNLCFRWMPPGFICEHASNAIYSESTHWPAITLVGLFNSKLAQFIVGLNESINVNIDDLLRMPVPTLSSDLLIESAVRICIHLRVYEDSTRELNTNFTVPICWQCEEQPQRLHSITLTRLEAEIDDEVFRLYGISEADRVAIEAEVAREVLDKEVDEAEEGANQNEDDDITAEEVMTREELAVRWISYAVGVVLGRFEVGGQLSEAGGQKPIGRAVYHRDDFAIGSLPAPDEAEFDELVGPVERFAYVDAAGGRHVFPAEVEQALRDLALPDGISVLDEGHPRDLPALVEKALRLMLDPAPERSSIVNRQLSIVNPTDEVITLGANGDLRKFLEKDFFTKWHLKWYRKRPVYWPLQSARRGYGFVLFHEKVEKYTLYVLLRDYLDHKLNGLRLQIEDLLALAAGQTGAARRQTERQLDKARQLLDEVNVFAQAIDRIAKGGYQPEANWIDDGVILRLAPLWELIPVWKAEPKKYWERLERGDYDWSHIAMAYWQDRVRAACRVNKSFAIAHGHEEWYEGG